MQGCTCSRTRGIWRMPMMRRGGVLGVCACLLSVCASWFKQVLTRRAVQSFGTESPNRTVPRVSCRVRRETRRATRGSPTASFWHSGTSHAGRSGLLGRVCPPPPDPAGLAERERPAICARNRFSEERRLCLRGNWVPRRRRRFKRTAPIGGVGIPG